MVLALGRVVSYLRAEEHSFESPGPCVSTTGLLPAVVNLDPQGACALTRPLPPCTGYSVVLRARQPRDGHMWHLCFSIPRAVLVDEHDSGASPEQFSTSLGCTGIVLHPDALAEHVDAQPQVCLPPLILVAAHRKSYLAHMLSAYPPHASAHSLARLRPHPPICS